MIGANTIKFISDVVSLMRLENYHDIVDVFQ